MHRQTHGCFSGSYGIDPTAVCVAYKFSENQQLQLSYSRRISRFYFRLLLPFSNFSDRQNNRVGNPNLRPEFSDAYEIGFLQYLQKGSILSSVYYRHTTGVIERLTLPANDGTTIRFPVNLSTRDAYGLEVSLTYDFTDWWRATGDANFYRSVVDGQDENVDYGADFFSWSGRVNSRFDIGEKVKTQISFDYDAPERSTQGRKLATYELNWILVYLLTFSREKERLLSAAGASLTRTLIGKLLTCRSEGLLQTSAIV